MTVYVKLCVLDTKENSSVLARCDRLLISVHFEGTHLEILSEQRANKKFNW